MQKNIGIIIWSEDYKRLAKWYEEILGFKVKSTQSIPGDVYVAFDFGENYFSIGEHSEVHGKNKDPYRIMLSFNVSSVTAYFNDIETKGVDIIADPFESPEGGYWVTTIQDPEGNILQFFGPK